MDERRWLSGKRSAGMLEFLRDRGRASPRKCRLFACAVGRLLPRLRSQGENQEREGAIEVAERFADGLASAAELGRALRCSTGLGMWTVALADAFDAAEFCASEDQLTNQAKGRLLLCLFGNPFRPVTLEPAWQTADVVALARTAYADRLLPRGELDSTRLAVLADALLDAGCTEREMLEHLRRPGLHVRGCFSVDLCLGRG